MNNQEKTVNIGEFWAMIYAHWSKVCKKRELLGSQERFNVVIESLDLSPRDAVRAGAPLRPMIAKMNQNESFASPDFIVFLLATEWADSPDGQRFREWAKREWAKHSAS